MIDVDGGEMAGEAKLQPHQVGQRQPHQPYQDRHARILDGDHLVILAPDVLGDETVRRRMPAVVGDVHEVHHLFSVLAVGADAAGCVPYERM